MTDKRIGVTLGGVRRALTPLRNALGIVNPDVLNQIRRELRDQVVSQGRKFSKLESLYLPFTPFPPGVWLYDCANCEFYQQRTCEIVEGNIAPAGWCGFWVSRVGDKPLSWVAQAVSP